jgi:hypothetical protein
MPVTLETIPVATRLTWVKHRKAFGESGTRYLVSYNQNETAEKILDPGVKVPYIRNHVEIPIG